MLSDDYISISSGKTIRLNPCSNGICSLTKWRMSIRGHSSSCLNPCSNGICSLTRDRVHSLWAFSKVLILVLMEYALWHLSQDDNYLYFVKSLNPCSNGICSLTLECHTVKSSTPPVLILVLMEYALWRKRVWPWEALLSVLILVLMEYALWPGKRDLNMITLAAS